MLRFQSPLLHIEQTRGRGRLGAAALTSLTTALLLSVTGGSARADGLESLMARFTDRGAPDTSFNRAGMYQGNVQGADSVQDVALQPLGDQVFVLTAGYFGSKPLVTRFTPAGAPDTNFGYGGATTFVVPLDGLSSSWAVAVADAGRGADPTHDKGAVFVAGHALVSGAPDQRAFLTQLQANGTLEPKFAPNTKHFVFPFSAADAAQITDIKAYPPSSFYSGMLAVSGIVKPAGATNTSVFAVRYRSDGSPDGNFNRGKPLLVSFGASADSWSSGMSLDRGDGMAIAGAFINGTTGTAQAGVIRVAPDGTLDKTFNGGRPLLLPRTDSSLDAAQAVAVDADNRLVLTGILTMRSNGADTHFVARVDSAGKLDDAFGVHGWTVGNPWSAPFGWGNDVEVDSKGRIVVTGAVLREGVSTGFVARYQTSTKPFGTLDLGFDGDGLATPPLTNSNDAKRLVLDSGDRPLIGGSFTR